MLENKILGTIEDQYALDRTIDPIQDTIGNALERAPVLHNALSGKWLGHPLHAALTDIPVGAFTTVLCLDALEIFGGQKKLRYGADVALKVGVVGALGAALAGLADWSHTEGGAKRVGFVHGLANALIGGLYGASLYARSQKKRKLGISLSTAGFALLICSSWLGGEMVYHYGVGVERKALKRLEREKPRAKPELARTQAS